MTLILLMSLQAAASSAPPPPRRIGIGDFDLARTRPAASRADLHSLFACDNSSNAEIVVCARRAGPAYPIEEMARMFEAKPLKAETGLGHGVTGNVHVEDFEFPNGQHSHRVMVGVKLPF